MQSVIYKPFTLSVIMMNVVMPSVIYKPFTLSVVMMNVVMLSVVAPFKNHRDNLVSIILVAYL